MQNQINSLKGDLKNEFKYTIISTSSHVNQQATFQNNLQNMIGGLFQNHASTSGTLPSNTIPNLKGEMKAITTRSGVAYEDLDSTYPSPNKVVIASILEGFIDDPLFEENDDLFNLECKTNYWKRILYDAPIDKAKCFDPGGENDKIDAFLVIKVPTYIEEAFNLRHEPDVPVINNVDELNEDECFDLGGGEINVEVEDSFTFVIQTFLPYLTYPEVSPLLSSI
ncbi:hypothetical protein Tco_0881919 [Tanacetum coccineum]